jgi:hypothetical protein
VQEIVGWREKSLTVKWREGEDAHAIGWGEYGNNERREYLAGIESTPVGVGWWSFMTKTHLFFNGQPAATLRNPSSLPFQYNQFQCL